MNEVDTLFIGGVTFETPNLDGLNEDELHELGACFLLLAAYANGKATAMKYRATGQTGSAIGAEKAIDILYRQLPKWAKW